MALPILLLTERPRDGWSVVNEQGETVAFDLELTPELVRAGRAREVIRVIQEARKSSGLDVSDRILCASPPGLNCWRRSANTPT